MGWRGMCRWAKKVGVVGGSSLGRAGWRMAVATLTSRVAGFLRIVVLTAVLGLGTRLLDTYNVANTLPNAVYELVVGGAMASVVVPLLTRAALTDPDDGERYAQRLLSLMVYGLGAVTLVALAAAPWLVDLYAPGFTAEQRDLAVVFSWYFLPQILFYGVSAAAGAVLNIRGRFAAPAWAPLCNSLVVITFGLIYLGAGGTTSLADLTAGQLTLLALGTSAGVFAQMALVVGALARSGFPIRLPGSPGYRDSPDRPPGRVGPAISHRRSGTVCGRYAGCVVERAGRRHRVPERLCGIPDAVRSRRIDGDDGHVAPVEPQRGSAGPTELRQLLSTAIAGIHPS